MASSEAPVQIEPLTKEERKQRGVEEHPEDSPFYPEEWKDRAGVIRECAEKGFKYYRRKKEGDKVYMQLRKGKKEKGLGLWSEEKEQKLFTFYPNLETMGGIPRPAPYPLTAQTGESHPQGRTFLSIPINRIAIIPRDYVPTINVIRYFQLVKENGFPGDFSKFINDMVTHHMHDCHGVELPYVFRQDEEDLRRSFYEREGENSEETA